jgi:hypothetical protein
MRVSNALRHANGSRFNSQESFFNDNASSENPEHCSASPPALPVGSSSKSPGDLRSRRKGVGDNRIREYAAFGSVELRSTIRASKTHSCFHLATDPLSTHRRKEATLLPPIVSFAPDRRCLHGSGLASTQKHFRLSTNPPTIKRSDRQTGDGGPEK